MKQWLNKNIVGFSLASFFNDFCHEMTTAILPSFIHQIVGSTYTPTALGFIQGVADGAATGMKLLSGWLSDRVPLYKPFLILGYGLTGIFIALIGTARSAWQILIYKTIAWMSRGFREPMRDTWISKITPRAWYGHAFGFQRAWDTLGALVGPLCAFIMIKMGYSLSTIFFFALIPGLLSVVPLILLTSEKKESSPRSQQPNFIHQIKNLPSNFNYFVFVMLIFGLGNFNQTLLIYRIQEMLGKGHSFSMQAIGLTILLYTFANIVRGLSEFGMGALSDYVNRKMLLAIFGLGFFGIMCIGFMSSSSSTLYWLLLFALGGFSAGTIKSLEKSHAASLLPEHVRGTGMGVLQTIDGIGDLLSSIVAGSLWTIFSPIVGFSYAAILSFIAMILLLLKR